MRAAVAVGTMPTLGWRVHVTGRQLTMPRALRPLLQSPPAATTRKAVGLTRCQRPTDALTPTDPQLHGVPDNELIDAELRY